MNEPREIVLRLASQPGGVRLKDAARLVSSRIIVRLVATRELTLTKDLRLVAEETS